MPLYVSSFSSCHYHRLLTVDGAVWSNFEIADMDFWRGEAYSQFFEHLESKGGFYYEVRGLLLLPCSTLLMTFPHYRAVTLSIAARHE